MTVKAEVKETKKAPINITYHCSVGDHLVKPWEIHKVEEQAWLSEAQKEACVHLKGGEAWFTKFWRPTNICKVHLAELLQKEGIS
tara:strand:+ start:804 stop:1058 length:255 start_codon:yes stop_codon:yes gene_type:complete